MRTALTVLLIVFLSISATAKNLDGKGIFCADINQGFFFEAENIVRIYRIYGMEVWDWELSSYDEVGTHQIEWNYDGALFHLDELTLIINGMNDPCEIINSGMELKKRLSPLPFFETIPDERENFSGGKIESSTTIASKRRKSSVTT